MVKQTLAPMTTDHPWISIKRKVKNNSRTTLYYSACGEQDHNASKCKVRHTLFCDFSNKKGHIAK